MTSSYFFAFMLGAEVKRAKMLISFSLDSEPRAPYRAASARRRDCGFFGWRAQVPAAASAAIGTEETRPDGAVANTRQSGGPVMPPMIPECVRQDGRP